MSWSRQTVWLGKAEYMDEAARSRQADENLPGILQYAAALSDCKYRWDPVSGWRTGADSIPIRRAIDIGNEKIVVVLTRNRGYRKKAVSKAVEKMYRRAYRSYPNLLDSCGVRRITTGR